MLTLEYLRDHRDQALAALQKRHFAPAESLLDEVLAADVRCRQIQTELDGLKAEANQLSRQIGELMKAGKREEAEQAKTRSTANKARVKELEDAYREATEARQAALVQLPNTPHASVKAGKSAEDNELVAQGGTIPTLGAEAVPHWDLIQRLDIIDFELGNKITGAGFPVYKGKGAKLQRALINFFLDRADQAGYDEVQPPHLVNRDSGYGTGQLPDKDGQMYHATIDELYLIPTAEVPITNIYRDVLLEERDLPKRNAGYTPCFRREAGSWGAEVRGLNRLHQFDKVEIVQIAHPDQSYEILEQMCAHVEGLLRDLGLPYRRLRLCGGDMGFTSALTYDFEVFSAAQQRWLEVSSVSNFETFQANRLQLRFRPSDGSKNRFVHTLNGSALALPRIVAALLENNQTAEGVNIPAILQPYTKFDFIAWKK